MENSNNEIMQKSCLSMKLFWTFPWNPAPLIHIASIYHFDSPLGFNTSHLLPWDLTKYFNKILWFFLGISNCNILILSWDLNYNTSDSPLGFHKYNYKYYKHITTCFLLRTTNQIPIPLILPWNPIIEICPGSHSRI